MFGLTKDHARYSKLENDAELLEQPQQSRPANGRLTHLIISAFAVIFVGIAGFLVGRLSVVQDLESVVLDGSTIQYAPMPGYTIQQVRRNSALEAPSPADGSREPAWDALLPNGLGFIRHPTLAPELAAVGVFHQLHCLYTVRRAYYAAYATAAGQTFNMTGVRDQEHVAHCFTYLQQALVCASNNGIEPHRISSPQHIHFDRQCRNFEELKAWAEEWRAVDGHGFLYDKFSNHGDDRAV